MSIKSAALPPIADFERTMLPYLDELYGTAVRMTGSRAEADDLVQEATMRAWAFFDRFEAGTNARAWLHRILTNTFINGYRRRRREREILAEVRTTEKRMVWLDLDDKRAQKDGVGDEVEAALAELPEDFRRVVLLVDRDDKTYREVADTLGCPIGTVMSRLHRARRVLKRRLRAYARAEGYVAQAA